VSFLVDMPLSPGLAAWLRDQGYQAVHASEIDMSTAPDEMLLSYAKSNSMVVITADLDYPRLLALTQEEGPGTILFRGSNYSGEQCLVLLERVLKLIPIDELASSIIVVEQERIRRRRLPVS
jgi:predicted nuclease of predicted toxin-antitoxin system